MYRTYTVQTQPTWTRMPCRSRVKSDVEAGKQHRWQLCTVEWERLLGLQFTGKVGQQEDTQWARWGWCGMGRKWGLFFSSQHEGVYLVTKNVKRDWWLLKQLLVCCFCDLEDPCSNRNSIMSIKIQFLFKTLSVDQVKCWKHGAVWVFKWRKMQWIKILH